MNEILAIGPPAPNSGGARVEVIAWRIEGGGVRLQVPFGHDAEEFTGAVGFGLNRTPFRVIAEAEGAELIDRFADVGAGAD